MKKIVIATNNKGKIREIKQILNNYELLTLNDINCSIEIEEDQETFEGNSLKKAKEISQKTNMPCIADDSGLCIDAFDGWPGVYTARFLGENASQEERNNAILEKMKKLKNNERNIEETNSTKRTRKDFSALVPMKKKAQVQEQNQEEETERNNQGIPQGARR